jgi:hypothetical protein
VNHVIDIVFDNLYFRKVYHVAGGLLIVGLLVAVDNGMLLFLLGVAYVAAFWLFGHRISFAVLGGLLLALLTRSRFACTGAYLILTVGDGAAVFVGTRTGSATWPWHLDKTIAGTAAFFVTSCMALALFLPLTTSASASETVWLAVLPSAVGAAVECAPIRIIRDRKPDDNLLIILSTGLTLAMLVQLLSVSVTL